MNVHFNALGWPHTPKATGFAALFRCAGRNPEACFIFVWKEEHARYRHLRSGHVCCSLAEMSLMFGMRKSCDIVLQARTLKRNASANQ